MIKAAKPFLKWAGGKTQLLTQFEALYPPALKQGQINTYVDPFTGGGAVFFEVAQKYNITSAYLFDVNVELILAYKVVQKDPQKLIERLGDLSEAYKSLAGEAQKKFYYEIRTAYNAQRHEINYQDYAENWTARAAMLIFMNRTCFNGLFRLNSKGEFNVPHGRYKNPRILDEANLVAVSRLLQMAELRTGDFKDCKVVVNDGSFVYFDPPYRPLSKTASFTSYSTFEFDDQQQIRLGRFFRHLDETYGAKLMLSNSDLKNEDPQDQFFENLYQGFHICRVSANRMINSNAQKRGQINELVITNYAID